MPHYPAVGHSSYVGDLWGKWTVAYTRYILIFIPTSLIRLLKLSIFMSQDSLRFGKAETQFLEPSSRVSSSYFVSHCSKIYFNLPEYFEIPFPKSHCEFLFVVTMYTPFLFFFLKLSILR